MTYSNIITVAAHVNLIAIASYAPLFGKLGSIADKAADIASDYITNDALPESQSLQSQIRADLQQRLNSYKSQ